MEAIWDYSKHTVETHCESPIEKKLAVSMYLFGKENGSFVEFIDPYTFYRFFASNEEIRGADLGLAQFYMKANMLIVPNARLSAKGKNYRVDFLICSRKPRARRPKYTIVECDSFLHHSSPKELENEKRRERNIQSVYPDWKIMRFSGREITKNADKLAKEIYESCLGKTYGEK